MDNAALEKLIQEAILKVSGTDERSLCQYLPYSSSGYMHIFTFKKMKRNRPQELCDLIQRQIMAVDNPQKIPPLLKDPYGQQKMFTITLTETEMDQILRLARRSRDFELLDMLLEKQEAALFVTTPPYTNTPLPSQIDKPHC